MASEPHPLRISKNSQILSSPKMAGAAPRPLSEISPAEKRNNSPSWHQVSQKQKMTIHTDSSPFQSSPAESVTSPRMFWQNRNTENSLYGGRTGSPSPNRRSSIERLQKASRVKNSNILALEQKQEYDPTRLPTIERPLSKVQGSTFSLSQSLGLRSPDVERSGFDVFTSDSRNNSFAMNMAKSPPLPSPGVLGSPRSPSRDQVSPTKSSLSPSKFKSSFDPETGIWSGESPIAEHDLPSSYSLHRHTKSVTFDNAPPQINEYEMTTPDISSIGTNSREGSYESIEDDDDEDDMMYDPGRIDPQDDSFDASLEDTDKTPVVGPDDWRGESPFIPGSRQTPEYERSPMPESSPSVATPGRPSHSRTNSANSNGEHRPLPPLPGVGLTRSQSNSSSRASPGLSATAERMLGSHRSLPSPPPATSSKFDIQNIGNGKMTLEERLRLMMLSDESSGKTAAEQQRERRLRRGLGKDRFSSPVSEPESSASFLEAQEEDDIVGDISGLEDYQLPARISRESIMRRVNGSKGVESEADYNFSSPPASSSPQRGVSRSPERPLPLDPDEPLPSTEDSILDDIDEEDDDDEGSVIIRRDLRYDSDSEDDVLDLYQDSEAGADDEVAPKRQLQEDEISQYSEADAVAEADKLSQDQSSTPRATTPVQSTEEDGSLPNLAGDSKESSLSRDLGSYMLSEPEPEPEETSVEVPPALASPATIVPEVLSPKFADTPSFLQRPLTPEQTMSMPDYDGSGWGEPEDEEDDEPGTPDSVIHCPVVPPPEEARESPAIPERLATIKANGAKLKTRVSNTPADLAAMREARRHVSYEVPDIPAIPERHRNPLSRDMSTEEDTTSGDYLDRHPSFKNRSLTLDLDLGLSLDKDFDRVIESQNRGYLMRQNTKLVAASDKDTDDYRKARSAGNSPVKKDRPQSWTVEPWNPQQRKRSIRKRPVAGPVPPLPGQESNAVPLNQVAEEEVQAEAATPDSGERGRLFVKVMGVKDLDLPIPKSK
jgi:hypothetical protein